MGAECGSQGFPVEPGRLPVQPARLRGAAKGSCHRQLRLRHVHQLPARSRRTMPTLRRHICHTAQTLHQGPLPASNQLPSSLCAPSRQCSRELIECAECVILCFEVSRRLDALLMMMEAWLRISCNVVPPPDSGCIWKFYSHVCGTRCHSEKLSVIVSTCCS